MGNQRQDRGAHKISLTSAPLHDEYSWVDEMGILTEMGRMNSLSVCKT